MNLTPRPHCVAATRIYRLRILNASNARVYRLAFLHNAQHPLAFHIIGNDGGLLDRPYAAREVFLAPAERVDVLLDLRRTEPGDAVILSSLAFDAMHAENAAGSHVAHTAHSHQDHGAALPDGVAFDILKIKVENTVNYRHQMPSVLSRIAPVKTASGAPRVFTLTRAGTQWRINGLAYDMAATPVAVDRNSTEVWEFRNDAQGMPHPMHVHGVQFQVLERAGSPEQIRRLALPGQTLSPADLGWKDTVLVWPGESVRIAIDFSNPFRGDQIYMLHCHNLEHEDRGMMLNFKVAI